MLHRPDHLGADEFRSIGSDICGMQKLLLSVAA
jgi:hypothetical protein